MSGGIREQLETNGYAIVEDALDEATLHELVDDYHQLLERLAPQWQADGIISSAYAGMPFDQRLTAILGETSEFLQGWLDITLPNDTVYPETPIHISPAVYRLLRHPGIVDRVEEILGCGEILANPIQHVRIKPPQAKVHEGQHGLVRESNWHQDQGVARPVADDTEMITVWLAITDATIENGCLQIVPRSHLQGMTTHCPFDQMTIPDPLLAGEPMPVPVKAGSALFMHRLTQHGSLANNSDGLRWSFDLRYQPVGDPTGRDEFPGLIVRSRQDPSREQSYPEWYASWYAARDYLAGVDDRPLTHRWDIDVEACA